MAPVVTAENSANKRKRDLDEHAKRKRTKRERQSSRKSNGKNKNINGLETGEAMALDLVDSKAVKRKDRPRNRKSQVADKNHSKWILSKPIGGRMLNIDPILTEDENHVILAYNTSLQVYSASDSLLVRKIQFTFKRIETRRDQIAVVCLSPTSPNLLWVASHGGSIWLVDWTTGLGSESYNTLEIDYLHDMMVDSVAIGDNTKDVLFVSAKWQDSFHIIACDMVHLQVIGSKIVFTHTFPIENLRAIRLGYALCAYSAREIILGTQKETAILNFDNLEYEFISFESNDDIACMDVQITDRVHLNRKSQREASNVPVLNLVVGCTRGAIFAYSDLLPQLHRQETPKIRRRPLHPHKYHWHRKAVHSVKWSRDGNYIISGGSESTLVLHQLDTQKMDFLPHLSAAIENIVVSPRGASYVIHLDDNSTIILSTAEMKPTAYIAGIQAILSPRPISKDDSVRRIGQFTPDRLTKIPAIVSPANPSQIFLCIGNGQQLSYSGSGLSMPLIQAVDLTTMQSVSTQALTRTNPTDVNVTSKGHPITEPRITGITYSYDGRWLATADEWQPPFRDVNSLDGSSSERREVYLKFWSVSEENQELELMTRIIAPHHSDQPERVLDIAADPKSDRFATIGSDGMVRLWQPSVRQRDGVFVKGKKGRKLHSWACSQAISLQGNETTGDLDSIYDFSRNSGAVAFSEDGSVLACAAVHEHGSVVQIIETETGKIRNSLNGLIKGDVQGIAILATSLVVLSDVLMVYDLVFDELRYGVQLRKAKETDEDETHGPGASLMTHLATDVETGRFAVAVSRGKRDSSSIRSELAIFRPDSCEPESIEKLTSPITSLVSSTGSSGFLVLDSAAQLWTIAESKDTKSLAFAQPLADLHLDQEFVSTGETTASFFMDAEDDQVSEDEMDVDEVDDINGDTVYPAVVPSQTLAQLFDSAPAFAMPPIEDLFYQVARLFSAKNPVPAA
ncbi:WD40 repeat-like protein [Xylariaceae sp. FL0255]|nr:WD40 repeat-like protein [Xylariaceae sp. FL0255]